MTEQRPKILIIYLIQLIYFQKAICIILNVYLLLHMI